MSYNIYINGGCIFSLMHQFFKIILDNIEEINNLKINNFKNSFLQANLFERLDDLKKLIKNLNIKNLFLIKLTDM
jgi:hypothetical protein